MDKLRTLKIAYIGIIVLWLITIIITSTLETRIQRLEKKNIIELNYICTEYDTERILGYNYTCNSYIDMNCKFEKDSNQYNVTCQKTRHIAETIDCGKWFDGEEIEAIDIQPSWVNKTTKKCLNYKISDKN